MIDPSLEKRILSYYDSINRGAYDESCTFTDPDIPSKVPFALYNKRMKEFMAWCGHIYIFDIKINMHLNEKTTLYGNRDFAMGHTIWTDQNSEEHEFKENWVKTNNEWYTRVLGYFPPRGA